MNAIPLHWLKWLCLAALGCALAFGALALGRVSARWLVGHYRGYQEVLERRMRRLSLQTSAHAVAGAHALAMLLVVGCALGFGWPWMFAVTAVVAWAPIWILDRKHREYVAEIDARLDVFVSALANALRATPSVGRALAGAMSVTPAPLYQEVERALREMSVGSTVEQALGDMCERIGSSKVDAAMAGLLIGRQTGGDVPRILDATAETLREMNRLSGVLRAKTADGRAQANVLTFFPAGLVLAFDWIRPGYFQPLTETAAGLTVTAVGLALWAVSVVMVRRIMQVAL